MAYLRWLMVVPILALAWFVPRLGDSWFGAVEKAATRFASRKRTVVMAIGLAAVLTRLALLWRTPVPVPDTQDEFSYLLAADTFVHGRLTNAPHPLAIFFDTFHVLQHPTYQSIYPPAQGAVLALGQMLGHPWIGVLLSMALLCAAVTWMLQGWFPPKWALLGGLLVLLRIHLFSYWLDSYWGGAVAALGGALVLGAWPRLRHRPRIPEALLMGAGVGLLANSRPFEGLLFCIPVGIAVLLWLLSRDSPPIRITGPRLIAPVVVVTGLALAFVGYYNRQVTGNALLFPHVVNQQQYESLPVFIWGSPGPPRSYSNAQFEQFYNVVTRKEYSQPLAKLLWKKSYFTLQFFLGSALWIPLIAMPWTLGDRRIRLLLLQLCLSGLGLLAVRWFEPHYAAPLTAVIFAVLIQSMRHLRRWQCRGRPVGVFITRLVVLLVVARVLFYVWQPPPIDEPWSLARARVVKQLEASPGRQLVLVRYGPNHNAHDEWVYNAADIDHSRIVWAREIPGVDLKPLLDYFRGRTVWVLEPDRAPLELTPYRAEAAAQSVTPAH